MSGLRFGHFLFLHLLLSLLKKEDHETKNQMSKAILAFYFDNDVRDSLQAIPDQNKIFKIPCESFQVS
jgi:hypothetical protein